MNPEADKLAAVLQGIIDSACHPDIALRVISVELAPIRAALAAYRRSDKAALMAALRVGHVPEEDWTKQPLSPENTAYYARKLGDITSDRIDG